MMNVLRRIAGEVHNAVQVLLLVSESYKRRHKLVTFKPILTLYRMRSYRAAKNFFTGLIIYYTT